MARIKLIQLYSIIKQLDSCDTYIAKHASDIIAGREALRNIVNAETKKLEQQTQPIDRIELELSELQK